MESFRFAPTHLRAVAEPPATDWAGLDAFWAGFETDHEPLFAKSSRQVGPLSSAADDWATVDEFWEGYAAQQQPELDRLRDLLTTVRERWQSGASDFDDDPLTANWAPGAAYEGPLRPTVDEEDWSQWLAHLLRTSSGPFVEAFLGVPSRSPESVRREIVFSSDESTRRIDILVEFPETAVSIEVKNGDDNYRKTPETAALIEQESGGEWTHVLLLQQRNQPRLGGTFGDALVTDGKVRPTIESADGPPIGVRYWQDVSHTLRRILTGGHEPDSHWRASAYLFVTLIEQRILTLHSTAFIDPDRAGEGESARDLHRLAALDAETQIDYLETLLAADTTHE